MIKYLIYFLLISFPAASQQSFFYGLQSQPAGGELPELNTKFGVLVNGSFTNAQKSHIAKTLGVSYVRDAINIFTWDGTSNSYQSAIDSGLVVVLNINYKQSSGTPLPFPTDMSGYGDTIDLITDVYTPELVVIENEEINDGYHIVDLSKYTTMLQTASDVLHGKGLKLTNGGIYGTGLDMQVFRYIKNNFGQDAADSFGLHAMSPSQYDAANDSGSNPTLEAKYKQIDTVCDAVSLYCDYINIHPYEPYDPNSAVSDTDQVAITPGILFWLKTFCEVRTGKPCISNETGQRHNIQPDLVTSMLTEYNNLNFEYVLWFDGLGDAGVQPLNDQSTGALWDNGLAFRYFLNSFQ